MTVGIYLVRHQRRRSGFPPAPFQVWHAAAALSILVNLFLLVMPWYPPEGGATGGDVSFWYATYCVVGVGIIVGCAVYYAFWCHILPRLGGYAIRTETIVLKADGSVTHRLLRIPNTEVAEYDRTHDGAGDLIQQEPQAIDGGGSQGPERRQDVEDAGGKFVKRLHVKSSRPLSVSVEAKA